jgi:hypothetical protein
MRVSSGPWDMLYFNHNDNQETEAMIREYSPHNLLGWRSVPTILVFSHYSHTSNITHMGNQQLVPRTECIAPSIFVWNGFGHSSADLFVRSRIVAWISLSLPAYLMDCPSQWPAARSQAWTVFACSNTGIVSPNPTRGMDVCVRLFCVCVVLCAGSDHATGWRPPPPVQGVLSTMHRLRNWKSDQGSQGLKSNR